MPSSASGLPARCASDVCMRSAPVHGPVNHAPGAIDEIRRIARPACRVTFAGDATFAHKILSLGPLIERVDVVDGTSTASAWVVSVMTVPT